MMMMMMMMIHFSSLFLCAASITKRPIIGTAQTIHLRSYNHNYYNNKNTTTTTTTITNTSTINNYKIIELINLLKSYMGKTKPIIKNYN
jgi:hypothetical protein